MGMEDTFMWLEQIQIQHNNRIAAIHPDAKFMAVILYSITAMVIAAIPVRGYPLLLIPAFLFTVLFAFASGVGRSFLAGLKPIVYLSLFILIVQAFFLAGSETVWQAGFLRIRSEGLASGLRLCFSILSIAGIFLWFFRTTENSEIMAALEARNVDRRIPFLILSSIQVVSLLQRRARIILNAQQARGIETQGNLILRMKAFIPAFVPVILSAITSSEEQALALEARGFSSDVRRTNIISLRRSGGEWPLIICFALLLALAIGGKILWAR